MLRRCLTSMNFGIPLLLMGACLLCVPSLAAERASFAIMVDSKPLVTESDLVEYNYAEHAMEIRTEALARLPRPKIGGLPFSIVANGQTIYSGLFVPIISSRSYKTPTIWMGLTDTNKPTTTLVIQRPLYPESRFEGVDPRFDTRLRDALEKLGKLKPGDIRDANYDPELTKSLEIVLEEVRSIVPGTTREELGKIFISEAGTPSATRGRFVHRRCPYIKLDVEFDPSDPDQKPLETRLTDPIRKVSRPYLSWSKTDDSPPGLQRNGAIPMKPSGTPLADN
jgi:hypothetical protein